MKTEVMSRGEARYEVHRVTLGGKRKPSDFAVKVASVTVRDANGATVSRVLSVVHVDVGLWDVVVILFWRNDEDPS